MTSLHKVCICKVEAYARKAEAGGGFAAVVVTRQIDARGLEVKGEPFAKHQSVKFETQSEAMQWAWDVVNVLANNRRFTVAHFSSTKFRKDYTVWSA